MFLDEPTSGLDSASAFFVIEALRNIALDERIVICSIHQPSSFVFDLFDDLCLLSSGETIYFGEAKAAIKFFSQAGFPCPTRRNPSDHFLRCINSDFDKIAANRLRSQKDFVVYYERYNGHYGEGVFVLANFLSSLPFLVIISLSSGIIIYYMVKFHLGFSIYCYFCINLFCCVAIMESITMIVALLVPNFLMGIGITAAVIMLLTIAAGLYRQLAYLPKFFWQYPMSYISFTAWAVQGQYKNDVIGLEFEPWVPGQPKLKGERILETDLGVNSNHSKWWDLAALFFIFLCHRVVFFMVLKYKDRAVLLLHRLFAKQSLEPLRKTISDSFRREKYTSSKRHQPLHPLSSQEGLASPLP
ncbi:hypothetical protein GH714_034119 [Hevea brasiliensis]|uniref:ABC-2 type transporter domain-containing protein n=1 Tax=Hevea brasiliensis TaxID=3981 RepID=A0A6A6M7T4_HEVBR|nr:hypothetical protein GH714_034119 [Hevea brasiliensis]